ncbi:MULTISPECIES: sugar-binding domain-containing protein [unclassified Carboxylicivirga]|uniref:sugar-binding domain-containing protein n=1 Tax=Carboxylicivirga TaxID=1628153 RepID=UPI003D345F11
MKYYMLLAFIMLITSTACTNNNNVEVRTRESLDLNWHFIQEDIQNAEQVSFDDSQWRQLNVPHDWSIEGEYNENNPAGIAGAFLPTGIGWYRKQLVIEDLKPDEKYFVEFDGVYMNSDVWINGHHLGNRPYGYISFSYDLTPFLNEGTNVIAVRVDHSKAPSGRWYTGSGIYRHVWLTKTKNIYVPQWGTAVTTPHVSSQKANVNLQIQLNNETDDKTSVLVNSFIKDADGKTVAKAESEIKIDAQAELTQSFEVEEPLLWSPEQPNMYSIETTLIVNGEKMDQYTTPLGIRSIELKGSKGFLLNDKAIKFKGLSNHHDAGPVGAAVPDDVLYRRLKMLKEMGCNALRTTHNPFSPEFYTMCDTMGFMVMDEAFDGWWKPKAKHDYGNYFAEWWKRDLTDFMKRDRNHPSVVIWSIGNEVHGFTAAEQKEIVGFARAIDNTRPITQGRGYMAPHIDIAGFNGHGEFKGSLAKYNKNHPQKAIIGTEITHTLQTRGVYRTKTWYRTKDNPAPWEKPEQFAKMEHKVYKIDDLSEQEVFTGITPRYQSSYDNSIVRIGVRHEWNRVEERDYYLGNFRWTGFDYLGESFNWPARTANFGIIDLAGFPKDHYYLYQSLWSDKPMVHLLPHWTHPDKENVEIPVVVYTNCESAELFLNGQSLGEKKIGKERQLVWLVPYQDGKLTVIAKTNGVEMAEKQYITAGEPTGINIVADRTQIKSNNRDVVHCEITVVDEQGTMVPHANDLIEFEVKGPAQIIGVENGDILDLSPHKVSQRKAFNGKCLLMIQATGESGQIEVTAKAETLTSSKKIVLSE